MPQQPVNPYASPQAECTPVDEGARIADGQFPYEATQLAEVTPLGPPENRPVYTPARRLWAIGLVYWPLLPALAVLIYQMPRWRLPADVPEELSRTFFFFDFAPWLLLALFVFMPLLGYLAAPFRMEDHYFAKRLRKAIRRRKGSLITHPNWPTSLYVAHVPRERWHEPTYNLTHEIGLLRIDAAAARLVVEGDRSRYQIPVDSLRAYDLASFDKGFYRCHILRLIFQTADGPRELCLRVGQEGMGINHSRRRRQETTEALLTHIDLIRRSPHRPG